MLVKTVFVAGLFAHLMVFHRRGFNLSLPVSNLTPHIHNLVAQLHTNGNYDTLFIVLDSIQELLESKSACDQGAISFIGI